VALPFPDSTGGAHFGQTETANGTTEGRDSLDVEVGSDGFTLRELAPDSEPGLSEWSFYCRPIAASPGPTFRLVNERKESTTEKASQ
jgi:hypothetical protein